jgi:hypothetical protein
MTKKIFKEYCLTCESELIENNKDISQWKDYESKLYCSKCKEWKTGALLI